MFFNRTLFPPDLFKFVPVTFKSEMDVLIKEKGLDSDFTVDDYDLEGLNEEETKAETQNPKKDGTSVHKQDTNELEEKKLGAAPSTVEHEKPVAQRVPVETEVPPARVEKPTGAEKWTASEKIKYRKFVLIIK